CLKNRNTGAKNDSPNFNCRNSALCSNTRQRMFLTIAVSFASLVLTRNSCVRLLICARFLYLTKIQSEKILTIYSLKIFVRATGSTSPLVVRLVFRLVFIICAMPVGVKRHSCSHNGIALVFTHQNAARCSEEHQ